MDTKLLTDLNSGYKAAKEYARPIWDRRSRNFRLVMGTVGKKPKSESNHSVPYVSTLLENVWPILVSRLPISTTKARNADRDRDAARLMDEVIEYTFDVNTFDLTYLNSEKEAMIMGDAWTKVCWKYEDEKTDHASLVALNTNDVYPHPRKITLDDNWPIFIRNEMTKQEMIEKGWDKAKINSLGESKLETEQYRKQQLDTLGYTATQQNKNDEKKDDLYEVVEQWGKRDLSFGKDENAKLEMSYIVFVNGEKIINTQPFKGKKLYASPYSHDKIPLAQLPWSIIPHMLLSESFVDPIASLQEELNMLENEKTMNYRRRNRPPIKVRRSGNVDLSTLKYVQSLPWLMNSMDDVEPFILPDLAPSIDNQQNMIRGIMQARSGANDVLLVTDSASIKGGDTATGASIANENTKMRFRPQATLIDLYIERIGELLIAMYQDKNFFDHEKAIAIADEEGNYFEEMVRPDDIKGDLQFKVLSASSLAESNQAKLQKFINLKELYIQDPSINQDEFDKQIFDAADLDFNKVKRTKDSMAGDAAMKLKQLVSVASSPQFAQMPSQQQNLVLSQIDKLKQIVQQQSGGQQGGPVDPNAQTQPQDQSVQAGAAQ